MSVLSYDLPSSTSSWLHRDVAKKIANISAPPVPRNASVISMEDFKPLSSYNWVDASDSTIVVPGAPAKWNPKALPVTLKQDRGLYYIDQNRYRCPIFPLEPLFRSIYMVDPCFDPNSVDLFTDRNNLLKLISATAGQKMDDFRIEVEIVGNTLLFTRTEERPDGIITGNRGFGHEFEKQFTEHVHFPGSESTGHYRVIQYSLGGITLVVRFEVDGYMDADYNRQRDRSSDDIFDFSVERLSDSLASTHINQGQNLKILHGGYEVRHESIIELKSRMKHRPLQTNDFIYQLWFGQVPWLIVGYHVRGKFTHLKQSSYKDEGLFETFEAERKGELIQLIGVIRNIKKGLEGAGKKRGVVIFEDDTIKLYEMKGNTHSLPKDLLEKWN